MWFLQEAGACIHIAHHGYEVEGTPGSGQTSGLKQPETAQPTQPCYFAFTSFIFWCVRDRKPLILLAESKINIYNVYGIVLGIQNMCNDIKQRSLIIIMKSLRGQTLPLPSHEQRHSAHFCDQPDTSLYKNPDSLGFFLWASFLFVHTSMESFLPSINFGWYISLYVHLLNQIDFRSFKYMYESPHNLSGRLRCSRHSQYLQNKLRIFLYTSKQSIDVHLASIYLFPQILLISILGTILSSQQTSLLESHPLKRLVQHSVLYIRNRQIKLSIVIIVVIMGVIIIITSTDTVLCLLMIQGKKDNIHKISPGHSARPKFTILYFTLEHSAGIHRVKM